MDSMDSSCEPCAAVDQQTEYKHQQSAVARGRHWGCLTGGVAAVAALGLVLTLPLPVQAKTFQCGAGDVPCLIAAMTEANANGQPRNTIHLAAGTYTLTAVDNTTEPTPGLPPEPNGLPSVTSTLTLRGEGAEHTVIERAASTPMFRLLHVTGSLTLQGLTLRGGSSFFDGGGLFNSGTVTLRHCTLMGNVANRGGGGIYNRGTLTLRDSILRDNEARQTSGGGLINSGGLVTIAHSTFDSNSGDNSAGGLLNAGPMTIAHTTFVNNVSFGPAGGLFNGDTMTITDSTFVSNTALTAAGGLFNSGTLTITNTSFHNNVGGGASGGGGGLLNSGILTLMNSTIAGNTVFGPAPPGGGLANLGSGTVRVVNTILAGNSPDECGGAVTSLGHNLIGDPTGCTITLQPSDLTGEPGFDAFTDEGTPGQGHLPLLPTSPAIDAGDDAVCPRRDQLGQRRVNIPRVGTSRCDIGAVEFHPHGEAPGEDGSDQEDEAS